MVHISEYIHTYFHLDIGTHVRYCFVYSRATCFPCLCAGMDSPKGTNSEGEMPNDCVIGYKKCGQIHQSCLPTKGSFFLGVWFL